MGWFKHLFLLVKQELFTADNLDHLDPLGLREQQVMPFHLQTLYWNPSLIPWRYVTTPSPPLLQVLLDQEGIKVTLKHSDISQPQIFEKIGGSKVTVTHVHWSGEPGQQGPPGIPGIPGTTSERGLHPDATQKH